MDDGIIFAPRHDAVTCAARRAMVDAPSRLDAKAWMLKGDAKSRPDPQSYHDANREADGKSRNLAQRRVTYGLLNTCVASVPPNFDFVVHGGQRTEGPKIQLPPFPTLATLSLAASMTTSTTEHNSSRKAHNTWASAQPKPRHASSWPPTSSTNGFSFDSLCGGLAPLTPPQEADSFRWSCVVANKLSSPNNNSLAPEQEPSRPELNGQQSSTTSRPTAISLPGFVNNMSDQTNSPSTWLERAVSTIASSHSADLTNLSQVLVVVQALPSQSKNSAKKSVFEQIVEAIQQNYTSTLYMQITHAVPQVVSMQEVPASPPATPNNQQEHDDYFDNQTIFTHASPIPMYHGQFQLAGTGGAKASGLVTAPSSTQISTLERYIPPTTGQEVHDFWSISRRSYLVDRMTELHVAGGTLLLVYPTQVGGAVFARQYIGPVLDPFVRQLVSLNNMTTDVAAAMGSHPAVPHMKTFEDMQEGLKTLCQELTPRAPGRGLRGEFNVIHAEKAEVTLDRSTWLEWFIEQESGRLRQNIIDYQKAGGRMPTASPSSLAREVVEGMKNSKEEAGGVGIEVGVFVVRRSAL